MSIRTSPWPAGVPCWADLSTPDVDAALVRYGPPLGWEFDRSGEEYGGYVMCRRGDASAAGIGGQQQGAPPTWTLYLATDDADATAAAAQAAGGSVLAGPFDVGDAGRMAVIADPTGAVFGVWQHNESIGAELVNEPGGLVWEDLRSADPDAARAFYAAVFGYRYEQMAGVEGYTTFHLGDGPALGGIGPLMGAPQAHWLVYYAVDDADAAVQAIAADGGAVVTEAKDTPFGRLAVAADPSGAVLALMQTSGDGTPDREG
jgi:uncharacterized protein